MSSAIVDSFDRLECRNEQIRLRIKSLESKIPFLRPHEKWPTPRAIRYYHENEFNPPASNQSTTCPTEAQSKKQKLNDRLRVPKTSFTRSNPSEIAAPLLPVVFMASQSTAQNSGEGSSIPKGKGKDKRAKDVKLADFPFPISAGKKYTSFPQFSKLPAEIRIQIWELAVYVPRFIEAQFCTNYYQPAFINPVNRNVLLSVCHESRVIALVSAPNVKSQKALTFRPHPIYWARFWGPDAETRKHKEKNKPNRFLHFNPQRDTIFLRSLDALTNELQTLTHDIRGIGSIQHLALPLEKGRWLPSQGTWHHVLSSMRQLKTVTFMIGSTEKTWRGAQQTIELRDVEQWFLDGRCRDVGNRDGHIIDVSEVGSRMRRLTEMTSRRNPAMFRSSACTINFRVVAWKRGNWP